MKIREGFILRQVLDIYAVIGVGSEAYMPNRIMSVNETGAFLWRMLENGAEKRELIDALLREYETDPQTAEKDVDAFLNELRDKKLVEE